MDRRALGATAHGVAKPDTTEQLTHNMQTQYFLISICICTYWKSSLALFRLRF